jgi:subtilisin family serine protease
MADRSLLSPADAAGVMTVGAINYNNWFTGDQEPFSSQGPTNDGRIKPDIMGPDNVSTNTYGSGFFGTSASSPHVAGAAALILHKFPGFPVEDLWDFLIATAVDMGSEGRDNIYGYGRLKLDNNATITTITTVSSGGSGGGGCFIATSAYGSYSSPYVLIVREGRDRFFIKSRIGKSLIHLYYKLMEHYGTKGTRIHQADPGKIYQLSP